jgi:hypothetical protein
MALISQSDVEARLGRTLTAEETTSFTIINNANQAYVEKLIGSKVESVSATSRYFDGGVQHLPIDPCTSISAVSIVNDDQTVEYTYLSSDYVADPANRTLKTQLRNRSGKFPIGIQNLKITAKYSIYEDTDILNIVKDALIESLVSEIDNSDSILKETIEGYSVERAESQSKDLLDSIKYLFPEI